MSPLRALDDEALGIVLDRALEMLVGMVRALDGDPVREELEMIMRRTVTSFVGYVAAPAPGLTAAETEATGRQVLAARLETGQWKDLGR